MNILKRILVSHSAGLWKNNAFKNKRLMFSSSYLGIDAFILQKEKLLESLPNQELYKERLEKMCETKNEVFLFSQDVFKMVYLTETVQDLNILHKLLNRICSQNKLKIEKFRFGTEVMRLHHLMNKPVEALSLMKNRSIFSQMQSVNSFMIFLDLLFKNNMYKEIIEMYNYFCDENPEPLRYRLLIFYFGACYKLNTKESFDLAIKMWQKLVLESQLRRPGYRIRLFLAVLSLKQNQSDFVIELLLFKRFNSLAESIKCMALAKSQRFYDMLDRIREILESDLTDEFFMPFDAVDYIKKEVHTFAEEEVKEQFKKIMEELVSKNLITSESLDHYLCADVESNETKSNANLKYEEEL